MLNKIKVIQEELRTLEPTVRILRQELSNLETKNKIQESKKYIGKMFKYRNSYDSNTKWWLYVKVIDVNKHGDLVVIKYQKTPLKTTMEKDTWHIPVRDCDFISKKEFNAGIKEVIEDLK